MRLHIGLAMLACWILVGCHTAPPPIARAALVGSYIYKSEDPGAKPTDHEWDHLTLQADGKYDLVQGGPTKPKTETVGKWTLVPWGGVENGPSLSLGNSGYPIEIKKNEIRLLVDLDVGIWWAKVN